jgi:ABC-type transport system involved in cytochrome c biogenesis permease component
MSDYQNIKDSSVELPQGTIREQTSGRAPGWWLVFIKELNDLWMGGKAPLLLLIFCIMQGALAYMMVGDASDPTPPKEMVYFTVENAIAVGLFIGLIIGADSISGERERLTLEALLLTPTSRRQIIVGKFLASISPWPAAFVITVPFLAVLSEGDEVFRTALLCGALMGTLMAPAFTGFAMLVSFWSESNKTSLFVSLVVYLMFLIPTQLPGSAQTGVMGRLFKRVNPMESNGHLLEKLLVNNRTLAEFWPWLASPVLFAVLVYVLLFWYAAPALRLEGGRSNKLVSYWSRRKVLSATACLMILLNITH